jgi:hypothetical protein
MQVTLTLTAEQAHALLLQLNPSGSQPVPNDSTIAATNSAATHSGDSAVASEKKGPSIDDVRRALVTCAKRNGTPVAVERLKAATGLTVVNDVPPDQFTKVIAEFDK